MRKSIYTVLLSLIMTFSFSSCEDFLDKEPVGTIDAEDFYQDINDMDLAITSVYSVLQSSDFEKSEAIIGGGCSDDWYFNDDPSVRNDEMDIGNFIMKPENQILENRWQKLYLGIHRANRIISNMENIDDETVDIGFKNGILGEAKFLRAFFYFSLVKTWGGVPIQPEIPKMGDFITPRSTAEEVWEYIENDLTDAGGTLDNNNNLIYPGLPEKAGLLPERWNKEYFNTGKELEGRVTKWTAKAFMVKALVFQARPDKTPEKWQMAEAFAKHVYEDGIYRLDDPENYMTKYRPGYNNGLWSIFEIQHSDNLGEGSILPHNVARNTGGSTGIICPSKEIRSKMMIANDPRQNLIFITNAEILPDGHKSGTWQTSSRLGSKKWYIYINEKPINYNTEYANNVILYRFSDLILLYAEAAIENNNLQTGCDLLNQVRDNVRGPGVLSPRRPDQGREKLRTYVWKERRFELAQEFHRFWDLVRQDRAYEVLEEFGRINSGSRTKGRYFVEGVNEIFPIPQVEIDLSSGIVLQNPGY